MSELSMCCPVCHMHIPAASDATIRKLAKSGRLKLAQAWKQWHGMFPHIAEQVEDIPNRHLRVVRGRVK